MVGRASGNLRRRVDTVATTDWWYTYPTGTHRVTAAGPHGFSYDGNGAMTTRTISGVTQTLDYDKAHRLTGITSGGDTTGFLYDAEGNRDRTTTDGTDTFQWGDWTWTPGDDPEMVYRFAGALVATRDGDGKLWWSIDDHLSSTTVQYHVGTDTVRHQRYLPFGKVRIDDGTVTDVGYTGQRLDATGLMFYQARYYDPLIGRFTTADTIVPVPANPQDLNRYTYVNNNPLRYTDPTGHSPLVCAVPILWAPCAGIGVAAVAVVAAVATGTIIGHVAADLHGGQGADAHVDDMPMSEPETVYYDFPVYETTSIQLSPDLEAASAGVGILDSPLTGLDAGWDLGYLPGRSLSDADVASLSRLLADLESSRPPSLALDGATHRQALRQAKRDAGVPTSQQPSASAAQPYRGFAGKSVLVWEFLSALGSSVFLEDHHLGHRYADDPSQDRGPHIKNPHTGGHYDYGPR